MKIFLLEDDESIGFGISTYLEKYGYQVSLARSLEEAREIFDYDYSLLILDVNLPDGTGFDFLEAYRIDSLPVIFLTVNDSEEDIVRGLNLADGYITKPFRLPILRAKMESILRRVDTREAKLSYKDLLVDRENYIASLGGQDLGLSRRELDLLLLLMDNRGRTLTRDKILEIVWDSQGDFVEDNSLSASIKRLRKKLGPYSYVVETVRGVGYRFVRD